MLNQLRLIQLGLQLQLNNMNYSLQRLLIIFGLVLVPFYEIFLRVLPFVRNMAPDSREPKQIIALVFALSIGLLAVFQGKIKPFNNKFILIIPIYLLFNLIMAPHSNLYINYVESGTFYFWKPFSEILIFLLMVIAISSMEIDIDSIINVMVICGTLMSVYIFLQYLGFDQFWLSKIGGEFTSVHAYKLGGNMGQPTLAGSFIAMMVPLAMYLKKYYMAIAMIIAVIMTQSMMAIMSLGFIGVIYVIKLLSCIRPSIWILFFLTVFISCGTIVSSNNNLKNSIISRMDGRYNTWLQIYSDIHNGQIKDGGNFSITGIGLGRFPFIFPDKNKSNFEQAHNDPLEFTYNCGLIGLFLLLGGIYFIINTSWIGTPICFSILLSFMAIFFCSLGGFPFQLGAHQFYSAILIGLLHNDKITRRIT